MEYELINGIPQGLNKEFMSSKDDLFFSKKELKEINNISC
jgi:hypothetical protein